MKILVLFIILTLNLSSFTRATEFNNVNAEPVFNDYRQAIINYSQGDGLSQVTVLAMEQDQLGFIWIGTQGGLNRFDGNEFKHFSAKGLDVNNLAGNYITALCDDGNKHLWIGTRTGLSVYDYHSGKFTSFLSYTYPQLPTDNVISLSCDKDRVWVGTEGFGFYNISYASREITLNNQSLAKRISAIKTTNTAVYLATDQGVFKQIKGQSELIQISEHPSLSLEIRENEIFIGRLDGWLDSYIINDESLNKNLHLKVLPSATSRIRAITSSKELLWLGTNNGVFVLNKKGEIIDSYRNNPLNPNSLNDETILSLLIDNKGNSWFGTESKGINYINSRGKQLGHVNRYSYLHSPLKNDDIRGFTLDSSNRFWVTTSRGAYIFIDGGFVKVESIYPKLAFLQHIYISNILIDKNDLWISTLGQGVVRFNTKTNKLTQFWPANNNASSSQYNSIVNYKNNLIFSSRGYGLEVYDESSNSLQPYINHFEDMAKHIIGLLVVDDSLWFSSSSNGIFRYQDNKLEQRTIHDGLLSNFMMSFEKDNLNQIWVSSDVGINILNKNFELVKSLTQNDGLPSDAIWTIIFDGIDSIWAGSSNGLARINVNDYSVVNFNKLDGAQDFEYNFGASWLSPQGKIFIGGVNGFNQFLPENILENIYIPPLYLVDILILGESIEQLNNSNGFSELPENINELVLDYQQDIITFKFTSLTYSHQKLNYFYRVLGLSDKWLQMDSDSREVNLIKLPPGDYQLESYAINSVGQKSEVLNLPITLHAPFWWSNFSKALYSFCILACLIIVWRIRLKVYRDVLKANSILSRMQQRLHHSLWASGDELWDWDLVDNSVHRHTVEPRIDYGEEKESIMKDRLGGFVHVEDQKDYRHTLEQCISQGNDSFEIAIRVKDLSNNWCWVLDKGRVIERNNQGLAIRIAGAFKDINSLKEYEYSLKALNEDLELKVTERTQEIFAKNEKVEQALLQLKHAQKSLIESEKMAALGGLVAGVAHEINTPLGVSITALSHNQDSLLDIEKMLINKSLRQADLEKSIKAQSQGYKIVLKNLDRASLLISNFKRVAVDQSSEKPREINLTNYMHEISYSLKPLFQSNVYRNKDIAVDIKGSETILATTYPGALFQIMNNFIENSLKHGFEGRDVGKITIAVSQTISDIVITYADDGVGLSESMLKQIYDPFVTSKRNEGGSGLGMHIVFNLVTQLFQGEIKCHSEQGKGIEFNIVFPKDLKKTTDEP